MSPFSREPGIVVVQPANQTADIERGGNRIQLVRGSRHARAPCQLQARNERAKQLDARGNVQGEKRAAQAVDQTPAGGLQSLWTLNFLIDDVIGDFRQQRVECRSLSAGFAHGLLSLAKSSSSFRS